ncbi:MAG: O-antigen ligase family protein [Elusimicrobiota bacterium]|nr:O-antigen ligase family protein [Elusimicrobiota bacterium]
MFVLNAVISYCFVDYKYNVRSEIFLLSSSVIIYLLVSFLDQSQKKIIINTSIFIGLWLAIYVFAFNLSADNILEITQMPYINASTCFLLVSFPLSFIFWNDKKKIYKFLPYILFSAILLTKFLLAIMIACLGFAGCIFFLKKHKIRIIFSSFFILLSMVCCCLLFKISFLADKMLIWKTALFVIKDNFLLGVGFNNYKTVSSAYGLVENIDISFVDNIFLQVLCENGIFGFIFFMLILTVFFYCIIRKIKENKSFYLPIFVACISFLIYNFFSSCAFISSNMLLFFFILAVPIGQVQNIKVRKYKINSHILILLFLPFIFALGKPIYAKEQYKKGLFYMATSKYLIAQDFFVSSICNDSSNPESFARLADIYFYQYQNTKKQIFIDTAISLYSRSLELNKYGSNYYYQLAWLYSFYGNKELAKKYLDKAIWVEPFNFLYYENYDNLIN